MIKGFILAAFCIFLSHQVDAATPLKVLEKKTTRCRTQLPGLFFTFMPNAQGNIKQIYIEAPDYSHYVPVIQIITPKATEQKNYFPLKPGEAGLIKFLTPFKVYVAKNHNGLIEKFVWGAYNPFTSSVMGNLLHTYQGKTYSLRFDKCTQLP